MKLETKIKKNIEKFERLTSEGWKSASSCWRPNEITNVKIICDKWNHWPLNGKIIVVALKSNKIFGEYHEILKLAEVKKK